MRHPLDHERLNTGSRMRVFTAIERLMGKAGSHPAAQEALRRPKLAGSGGSRLREFMRIVRGKRS